MKAIIPLLWRGKLPSFIHRTAVQKSFYLSQKLKIEKINMTTVLNLSPYLHPKEVIHIKEPQFTC